MVKPKIHRSYDMQLSAYYLSRCGQRRTGQESLPPRVLGVHNWSQALELFFPSCGDGRSLNTFVSSFCIARNVFDHLYPENGRRGHIENTGRPPPRSASLYKIHEEWRCKTDLELEHEILSILGDVEESQLQLGGGDLEQVVDEGNRKLVLSNRIERSSVLRQIALEIHGTVCHVCNFDFEKVYGSLGAGFIEIHHALPLAEFTRSTNPETDLVPLCSNCHRMVHRIPGVCLSVHELKNQLQ